MDQEKRTDELGSEGEEKGKINNDVKEKDTHKEAEDKMSNKSKNI